MGTLYKGACHDCRKYIDLDKFYSFCPVQQMADIETEEHLLEDYGVPFIYRSLRLHFFMEQHRGHRLGVYRDTPPEDEAIEEYDEVFPIPTRGAAPTDTIDLRDRKTPRVILLTRHGELILDTCADRVNCFRFQGGKRIDTVLLSTPSYEPTHTQEPNPYY